MFVHTAGQDPWLRGICFVTEKCSMDPVKSVQPSAVCVRKIQPLLSYMLNHFYVSLYLSFGLIHSRTEEEFAGRCVSATDSCRRLDTKACHTCGVFKTQWERGGKKHLAFYTLPVCFKSQLTKQQLKKGVKMYVQCLNMIMMNMNFAGYTGSLLTSLVEQGVAHPIIIRRLANKQTKL